MSLSGRIISGADDFADVFGGLMAGVGAAMRSPAMTPRMLNELRSVRVAPSAPPQVRAATNTLKGIANATLNYRAAIEARAQTQGTLLLAADSGDTLVTAGNTFSLTLNPANTNGFWQFIDFVVTEPVAQAFGLSSFKVGGGELISLSGGSVVASLAPFVTSSSSAYRIRPWTGTVYTKADNIEIAGKNISTASARFTATIILRASPCGAGEGKIAMFAAQAAKVPGMLRDRWL